jgi:hypothetical protein
MGSNSCTVNPSDNSRYQLKPGENTMVTSRNIMATFGSREDKRSINSVCVV